MLQIINLVICSVL